MNDAILHSLRQHIDAEKAIVLPRFFKTGRGEYGEGDKFLGTYILGLMETVEWPDCL